jgi:predicted nicotinamide N-methyase
VSHSAARDEEPAHVALLREQPLAPVHGCPELVAHQAPSVFALWQRWEARTGGTQEPPFWAAVWPGAALLCRLILDEPERVRGRRLFDVGCGSGVVAIAASLAGVQLATANDLHPAALDAARLNAEANGVTLGTDVGDATRKVDAFGPEDVLVLCEMFYERRAAALLRDFAARAHARGATVLVADGERTFLPHDELTLLRSCSMPVSLELEGVAQRRVGVYQWRAR